MPDVLTSSPTAVHAVAVVQDTPDRRLLVASLGLGVVWIDQLLVLAFHCSASVSRTLEAVT